MHAIKNALFITVAVCALAACAPKAADSTADEAAMKAGTEAWIAAYTAGDVDKMLALYADDAILMPPDAPAASGHDAMRAYLAADSAATKSAGVKLVLGASASGVSGDLGWHSGVFKLMAAAGASVGSGKYCEVWRKANGKWLLIRDIWNSDAPPPPPAATAAVPVK